MGYMGIALYSGRNLLSNHMSLALTIDLPRSRRFVCLFSRAY